jgi:hypothetical protein
VARFIEALKHALPECDEADLYWSYHFLSGALTMTMAETGRIDNLSGGACKSTDMAAISARMPQFIAAGFKAICGRDRMTAAKPAKARPRPVAAQRKRPKAPAAAAKSE